MPLVLSISCIIKFQIFTQYQMFFLTQRANLVLSEGVECHLKYVNFIIPPKKKMRTKNITQYQSEASIQVQPIPIFVLPIVRQLLESNTAAFVPRQCPRCPVSFQVVGDSKVVGMQVAGLQVVVRLCPNLTLPQPTNIPPTYLKLSFQVVGGSYQV